MTETNTQHNPYAITHKTIEEKNFAYERDVAAGKHAYYEKGMHVPLGKINAAQVEYIHGKWRVQNPALFPPETVNIDGMPIRLGPQICDKLPKNSNEFEFYHIVHHEVWDMHGQRQTYGGVAAVYRAPDSQIWTWGWNIAAAHEKLVAKVYGAYKGIIISAHRGAKTNTGK